MAKYLKEEVIKNFFNTNYHPELVKIFAKNNIASTITGNLIVPSIITYIFYDIIPQIQLFTWFILHVVIFLTRVILNNNITTKTNIYLILIVSSSVLNAVLAWQALIYGEGIHLLFAGMFIASISAGSITTLGSISHYFISYVLIQMLGLISAFLYAGQEIYYLSAALAVLFLLFILVNGYKQFHTLKNTLRLNEQVHDLLDNAGQGFLSFDDTLRCGSSFSSECKNIFNTQVIEGYNISELLFDNNTSDKELFLDGISRAIDADDESTKDIFLSLLPKEQTIGSKSIKIEYKHLKNNKFMVILTDITKTKNLKSKLVHQSQIQKMIVAVASDKNDFTELVDDFKRFTNNISSIKESSSLTIKDILKELHTFKGIFAQKEMIHVTTSIYELEIKIRDISLNDKIIPTIIEADLLSVLNKDISIIDSILGNEFLSAEKSINISIESIDKIELKLTSFSHTIEDKERKRLDSILAEVHRLKYESVKKMLIPYISHVRQLSSRLQKDIYELEIEGDSDVKVSPRFKPFMKSLIHLFNNCVDHGIEDIRTRTNLGKDEVGTLKCSFELISNMLIIQISDDGKGINTKELVSIAINKGLKTEKELELMSEEGKSKLIFTDTLSTKNDISRISGVGVGMNVIKDNLEKLNGKYSIENESGVGVTFTFYIPLNQDIGRYLTYGNKCKNICDNISKQIEVFLQDSLDLEITNDRIIKNVIIENNYAQIDFYGGFYGSAIMILSNEIKELMSSTLIPSSFNKQDREWLVQELPSEVLNTIIGLSLQHFDKSFGDINMSPPVHLDNFHLMKLVKDSKNKFIKEFDTSIGKIICLVIEKEKQ